MNIWGKSVLGSGKSKRKDMEAEMPGPGVVEEFQRGYVAAAERIKRIEVDGGQRGNMGQIT